MPKPDPFPEEVGYQPAKWWKEKKEHKREQQNQTKVFIYSLATVGLVKTPEE